MQFYIKPLNEFPQFPMDKETSRLLFTMTQLSVEDPECKGEGKKCLGDMEDFAPYRILQHRLNYVGLSVSSYTMAFLALTFPSPGTLMLFAHAIFHASSEGHQFTISDLCLLFPNGFPDDQHLRMAWDAQKLPGGGNGVDNLNVFKATADNPALIGE